MNLESTDTITRSGATRVLVEAIRPQQWIKNLPVFAGLIFGRQLFIGDQALRAGGAFAAMCFAASATYLFNDLRDREADRQHPLKRNRAIASGRLDERRAFAMAAVLAVAALAIGFVLGPATGATLVAYLILTAIYSLYAK